MGEKNEDNNNSWPGFIEQEPFYSNTTSLSPRANTISTITNSLTEEAIPFPNQVAFLNPNPDDKSQQPNEPLIIEQQEVPQTSSSTTTSASPIIIPPPQTFIPPQIVLPNFPQFLSDKEYEKLLLDFKLQYTQNLDPSIPDLSEIEENLPPLGPHGYIYFSQAPIEKEKKRLKTLWENSGRLKEGSGEKMRKKYRTFKKNKNLKKRILSLLNPPKELEGISLVHIAWDAKKT